MDDKELLGGLQAGDEAGLSAFIDAYSGYLYSICSRIAGESAMAEDLEECVSDCIISIWRNAGHIRPETFKPYVATAARRKAIDMKQRLTRTRFLPLEEDLIAQGEGVEEAAERSSTKEAVASAVNGLGQPDQEIFVRRYYWGESHKQIAQALGLTERAVEGKLYRGRSKLKELLGGVLGG